jgi:hypothetical protein
LISASTCAAAVPPWPAGEPPDADADDAALAVAARRGDGEPEDADAAGLARGGTITATVGDAATAMPAGFPLQGPVAAVPQPTVASWLTVARPGPRAGESAVPAR